jgi:septal ring factor EnvC (AmiA/AmiB activator)
VYVVGVAAFVIVAAITAAPSIIEKWRAAPAKPDPKPDPAPPAITQPVPVATEPPTDTLRSMISDLQARLTKSEDKEDALQKQVVELTGQLATARAEIAALRSQLQVMSMGRRDA